jgi:hypothetical protein
MLFPLLIGVAAGVALERYYLSEDIDSKENEKVKEDVKAKAEETKRSIMDFINFAKRHHPVLLPRRNAAKKLMLMLEGDGDETITKETFEKTKTVVEEYCGIRKLEYDEGSNTVCGGEINEECPEKPVLDSDKLECLSKAELILIAPKLEGMFKADK